MFSLARPPGVHFNPVNQPRKWVEGVSEISRPDLPRLVSVESCVSRDKRPQLLRAATARSIFGSAEIVHSLSYGGLVCLEFQESAPAQLEINHSIQSRRTCTIDVESKLLLGVVFFSQSCQRNAFVNKCWQRVSWHFFGDFESILKVSDLVLIVFFRGFSRGGERCSRGGSSRWTYQTASTRSHAACLTPCHGPCAASNQPSPCKMYPNDHADHHTGCSGVDAASASDAPSPTPAASHALEALQVARMSNFFFLVLVNRIAMETPPDRSQAFPAVFFPFFFTLYRTPNQLDGRK